MYVYNYTDVYIAFPNLVLKCGYIFVCVVCTQSHLLDLHSSEMPHSLYYTCVLHDLRTEPVHWRNSSALVAAENCVQTQYIFASLLLYHTAFFTIMLPCVYLKFVCSVVECRL